MGDGVWRNLPTAGHAAITHGFQGIPFLQGRFWKAASRYDKGRSDGRAATLRPLKQNEISCMEGGVHRAEPRLLQKA